MKIEKKIAPTQNEVNSFLKEIDFNLPVGFIDFFKETNGADLVTENIYIILWPLTEMIQLNKEYNVHIYAPEFFIFGSDGGDMAFAIQKSTGLIYEMPFIGMSKEEAILKSNTFEDFLNNL
jgi:SMI1 / KNR4 family (SUKH-1)